MIPLPSVISLENSRYTLTLHPALKGEKITSVRGTLHGDLDGTRCSTPQLCFRWLLVSVMLLSFAATKAHRFSSRQISAEIGGMNFW